MCGIYGIANLRLNSSRKEELLARMGQCIVHRGPDDEGHFVGEGVALGMRRLSIIDLAGGHQPIANEDETVWVVCNGEIYNYKELRVELEKQGHVFRSQLRHRGNRSSLRGRGIRSLQAAARHVRDSSLGLLIARVLFLRAIAWAKSPFTSARQSASCCVCFGDEVDPGGRRNLVATSTPQALREYLALGYVPAPWTLFKGIEKLLPGYYMIVEKGRLTTRAVIGRCSADGIEDRSEEEWIERVREKLLESVRIRLVSDVPLGAFLSGGIDSSAIVAAMAQVIDQPVKTYSIGFEGRRQFLQRIALRANRCQSFRYRSPRDYRAPGSRRTVAEVDLASG